MIAVMQIRARVVHVVMSIIYFILFFFGASGGEIGVLSLLCGN